MFVDRKQEREHEARAESIRKTVHAYVDDPVAFTRDVDLRAREMGGSHAGGKACNCGLCAAVAKADVREVYANAHLVGGPSCGCGRCVALTALAEQMHCPGPGEINLDTAELQKQIDGQGGGGNDPNAQPGQQQPAPQHALLKAEAANDNVELDAEVDTELQAQIDNMELFGDGHMYAVSNLFASVGNSLHSLHAGAVGTAKPAGFYQVLGLTNINFGGFTIPELKITTIERPKPGFFSFIRSNDFVAKINSTTAADATHPCVASPAGQHLIGQHPLKVKGKDVTFDVYLDITPEYHGKIAHAEQEHLDDLLLAYNLSIFHIAEVINAMTGTEFVAENKPQAEMNAQAGLMAKLPEKFNNKFAWKSNLTELLVMSANRDNAGWHTFNMDRAGPTLKTDVAKKTITVPLNDGTTHFAPASEVVHL